MKKDVGDRKIVIVGGGPAGMMAAIRAAQLGGSSILLEKNDKLGKKLLITGKGRCNVTNACEMNDFLKRFRNNGKFLRDAFNAFSNEDLMVFFKHQGVPLKIERQQRVFPKSDRSSSIVKALVAVLKKNGVEVRLGVEVEGLAIGNQEILGVKIGKGKNVSADAVILATGGISYSATGATGEGLRFAETVGHQITELRPALVSLEIRERFVKQLEGLTLKNIRLEFRNGLKKKTRTDIGELLFTAKGISGPLVISHSGRVADWLKEGYRVFVSIDLKPALSGDDLDRRLRKEFQSSPQKATKNLLKNLLPQRLIDVFLKIGRIDSEKQVNQITQKERIRLIELLKGFPVEVVQTGSFAIAMVTQGGISVRDIDPKTMQSRLVQNLYFAGEMIDVDGDTGGFNLQSAFSTGYLAGQSSTKKE